MATKILPISKAKTVYYGDELIRNFWKQKVYQSAINNHKKEIRNILEKANGGFACIQTERLTDKDIIEYIYYISHIFKVRVYILVNNYSQELNPLNEICLIRYEVNNKGSLVLVNPNSNIPQGIFFTGQLTEQSLAVIDHISIILNKNECEELFRHFCYMLWDIAKKEVIEKDKHAEIISKPLDVFHNPNIFEGKDFVYGTLFDFVKQAKRSDLINKHIIFFNQESQIPIKINESSTKDLGNNVCESMLSKEDFENLEPYFPDDNLSVNIKYQWCNVPFYLPKNAVESPLYEKWKKKQEEIVKQLNSILDKIQEIEKKEKSLSKRLSRFFLGKKNIFNLLKSDIDELKGIDYSRLSDLELRNIIKRINDINQKVLDENNEIDEENRRARIEEEIEKTKNEIALKESELKTKKQELEDKLQLRERALNEFCHKYKVERNLLSAKQSEWEKQSDKENKNKYSEEAEKKLNELKNILNITFISKVESEVKELEKNINSLINYVLSKEKELNIQVPQQSSSSLNELIGDKTNQQGNTDKSKLVQIPDLPRLPSVGKLFQFNNQHYLAIEYWEDYEEGRKEAERLKAILCAIES